jgi:hypothetical protein
MSVAPTVSVGDPVPAKMPDMESGESFGHALSQAKISGEAKNDFEQPQTLRFEDSQEKPLFNDAKTAPRKPQETDATEAEIGAAEKKANDIFMPATEEQEQEIVLQAPFLVGIVPIQETININDEILASYLLEAEGEAESHDAGSGSTGSRPTEYIKATSDATSDALIEESNSEQVRLVENRSHAKQNLDSEMAKATEQTPRPAQNIEAAKNARNENAEMRSDSVRNSTDQARSNEAANAARNFGQQAMRSGEGNMSLSEAADSLPVRLANAEAAEGMLGAGASQAKGQGNAALGSAFNSAPIIIESALPQLNKGEAQAPQAEAAVEAEAADSAKTQIKADKVEGENTPKDNQLPQTASSEKEAVREAKPDQPAVAAKEVARVAKAEQLVKNIEKTEQEQNLKQSDVPEAKGPQEKAQSESRPAGNALEANQVQPKGQSERPSAKAAPQAEVPSAEQTHKKQEDGLTKQNDNQPKQDAEQPRRSATQPMQNIEQPKQNIEQPKQNAAQTNARNGLQDAGNLRPQEPEALESPKELQQVKTTEITSFKQVAGTAKEALAKDPLIKDANASAQKITTGHHESHAANANPNASAKAAQPAAQASPKFFLPPQAPMAQLEGSVRWLLRTDAKGAEIQLHPENLGRVTVHLKVLGSEVHARIWATEAATLPMLKTHKAFLESSLKEQGLTLSSFDLQHGRGGQQAQGETNKQNHHFAPPMRETWTGSGFRQEMPTQIVAQHVDDGRVEIYA